MEYVDKVVQRIKDSSLSERLLVVGLLGAGAYIAYRNAQRRSFDRLIASWTVDLTEEERKFIAFIFHVLDRDHNLALDKREFRRFIEATPQVSSMHKSMQLDAFRMLDTNSDGVLSLPEFENFFKAIKNMAGADVASTLLEHFVAVVKEQAEKEGESPGSVGGTTQNDTTATAQKRRTAFKGANEYEKAMMDNLVLPKDIRVKFEDIGSLGKTKQALRELVIYPLKHPELFTDGLLAKAVKGILLFGPPGTGKTMLAKAVATESGASFLNIQPSAIGSKWHGESEKFAKAVFTVARKMAPTIVFIDEIDSLLQQRGSDAGGSNVVRSTQTVLMTEWDGLKTGKERVIVLGATNRPFDLDEAILRRMPRRLLVDVPDAAGRVAILGQVLKDDALAEDVDLEKVAALAKGFTGSDLHNMCREAAFFRVRETVKSAAKASAKKEEETADKPAEEVGAKSADATAGVEETKGSDAPSPPTDKPEAEPKAETKRKPRTSSLRPICMADFKKAMKTSRPSVSENSRVSRALREWNDEYGDREGGAGRSRKKNFLMYT